MNEQQLQQMLTIQQAIAAAATAAVINSLLNPQQQQQQQQLAGGANSPTTQLDGNNRTAQDLLLHLQQQAAAANLAQQQHDAEQQERPDSRLDSPVMASSPANSQPIDANNQTIQNLLLQLQAAAGGNPLSAISSASALAALNLNLNNQLPSSQLPNINTGASPVSRASMVQNDPFLSASPTTSSNIQHQANQMPSNKKLKRFHQPQPNQLQRSSQDATSKQHSSPKNHSTIPNLAPRNNPSSTTNSSTSSSSPFLPNNVGLPRKLVRGQDVWLGRGAEQTRQILKCMWCGQSFRTLAEMTQHMKVTQHYTNIISQEQITSWKQPESSDTNMGKQSSRQSLNQPKLLDDGLDTSSEKFNDSDRDDSFSNDDEPSQKVKSTKSKQSPGTNKSPNNNCKVKRDFGGLAEQHQQIAIKPAVKNRKPSNEERSNLAELSLQEDSDAENSSTSAASSHKRSLNTSQDALKGNDQSNKLEESASPAEKIKSETDEERTDPIDSDNRSNASISPDLGVKPKTNGEVAEDHTSCNEDEKKFEIDESERIGNDNADQAAKAEHKEEDLEVEQKSTDEDCEKIMRRRCKDKAVGIEALKQVAEDPKGDGSGDPLSALETMVEKSFDPRLRPGLASGGILQRLGIDEEVCPPWQHINYANWYAAAAYGHPMAAALLAAGMNLQNGIKLSKNMNQKKGDE